MSSLATVHLLRQGGWPEGLCRVIGLVWGSHFRWLVWQGHVDSRPLLRAFPCTPQGCAFGPAAICAWMCAGWNRVSGLTRIYMDDRSFTDASAQGLLAKVQAWSEFSASVALWESPGKVQLTGRTARLRRFLNVCLRISPFWVARLRFRSGKCLLSKLVV